MPTYRTIENATKAVADLLKEKAASYGNTYIASSQLLGDPACYGMVYRITEKCLRLKNLLKSAAPLDEIEAEFMDIAGCAVLGMFFYNGLCPDKDVIAESADKSVRNAHQI